MSTTPPMDRLQLRLSVARRAAAIGLASGAAIFCAGSMAWLTQSAMLAPPLGATAYLCFRAPTAIPCAPRNLLLGHALGLAAGWIGLWVTGAIDLAPALSGVFTLQHAAAAAVATALTVALMIGLGIEHPPAGATTVVVSLGLLKTFDQLLALELGALVIVVLAFSVHRLRGVQYPVWGPRLGLVTVPASTAAPAGSAASATNSPAPGA